MLCVITRRPSKVQISGINTRGKWILNYSYDREDRSKRFSPKKLKTEKEKERLACADEEEETGGIFGGPTVIKSVGRTLAYLLDSQGGEKKAVSCDNGKFYIYPFGFHSLVRWQQRLGVSRQKNRWKKDGDFIASKSCVWRNIPSPSLMIRYRHFTNSCKPTKLPWYRLVVRGYLQPLPTMLNSTLF